MEVHGERGWGRPQSREGSEGRCLSWGPHRGQSCPTPPTATFTFRPPGADSFLLPKAL